MGKIRIEQLEDVLRAELSGYGTELNEAVKTVVKSAAQDCKKDIQLHCPKRTGDYRKGWRSETVYDGPGGIRIRIFNRTDWQLTHLLENGHAKAGGGRVGGTPHIRPAEQKIERQLLQGLKEALEQ